MTNANEITLEKEENKMGVMPIPKLLITMSLPMMISMLIQALYNIVDSMFVAQLSENALTAVSLAFPIQSLMIAIAAGTGVGINALLSRNLGEKDFTGADKRNLSCHRKLYHLCHTRSFRLSFLLRYSDRQPADCRLWNSIPLDHYFLFCRNLLTDYFREIVTVYRPHNLQYDHTGNRRYY